MEVLLLANSSKDNTRVKLKRVKMDSYGLGLWKDKLYSHLLTSGIGSHLVCQVMPASSSTPYPDMGDYEGWTRLSPPAAYPSTVRHEANEGSCQPRHHVYAIDYYFSVCSVFVRAL
jgi:hypothetical protein